MLSRRPAGQAPGYFSAVTDGYDAAATQEGFLGRLARMAKLSLFAGAGVIAGLATEMQNRGDQSVIMMIAGKAAAAAGFFGMASMPLYAVLGGLVAIGMAVVLYFRPRSGRAAFAQGFGSLAALATSMPGPGLTVNGPQDAALDPAPVATAEAHEVASAGGAAGPVITVE